MKHVLDFEKPIFELQKKLDDLQAHPEQHSIGIEFEAEIALIQGKIEETRKNIFTHLTPWQRVQLARHPKRPFALDYITSAFSDFHTAWFSGGRLMTGCLMTKSVAGALTVEPLGPNTATS